MKIQEKKKSFFDRRRQGGRKLRSSGNPAGRAYREERTEPKPSVAESGDELETGRQIL